MSSSCVASIWENACGSSSMASTSSRNSKEVLSLAHEGQDLCGDKKRESDVM